MVERIRQFIDFTGLTVSQFADGIEVPRAVISHIMSGRNKPSLDVIVKVMANYRQINLNWLLLGEGDMLMKVAPVYEGQPNVVNDILPDQAKNENAVFEAGDIAKVQNYEPAPPVAPSGNSAGKNVKQIVFIYTDNTFATYNPE